MRRGARAKPLTKGAGLTARAWFCLRRGYFCQLERAVPSGHFFQGDFRGDTQSVANIASLPAAITKNPSAAR